MKNGSHASLKKNTPTDLSPLLREHLEILRRSYIAEVKYIDSITHSRKVISPELREYWKIVRRSRRQLISHIESCLGLDR